MDSKTWWKHKSW